MKITAALLCLLLFFPIAYGISTQADTVLNLRTTGTINVFSNTNYNIEKLTANVTFFPREDYRQKIKTTYYSPDPIISDDAITFKWSNIPKGQYKFLIDSTLKTSSTRAVIKEKVPYPITTTEFEEYTKPSKYIDSDNPDVIELASSLAQGENDLFVITEKLASWTTENVRYNLTTLTADTTQPSSWVLYNRQGVCDELTNLFIGMARSLGIPARFVSGLVYTDSTLFKSRWGPHGWAEVYFPEVGWVPFDPTYGQYGYVDSTHIKLKESIDSVGSSTSYGWLGHDAKVVGEKLNFSVNILFQGNDIPSNTQFSVRPMYSTVGFGSFNLIELTVENTKNYYIIEQVNLYGTEGMTIIGDKQKNILLLPLELKKEYFLVRVNSGLKNGYIYTFPIVISNDINEYNTSFKSDSKSRIYQKAELNIPVQTKDYAPLLSMDCQGNRDVYYNDAKVNMTCELWNKGNKILEDLKVCKDTCKSVLLDLNQHANVSFVLNNLTLGRNIVKIIARNKDINLIEDATITLYDRPNLEIGSLSYPSSVEFVEPFEINATLVRSSYSSPKEATLIVEVKDKEEYTLVDFKKKDVVLRFAEANFLKRDNPVRLTLRYTDFENKTYEKSAAFTIHMSNINPWTMRKVLFRQIFGKS